MMRLGSSSSLSTAETTLFRHVVEQKQSPELKEAEALFATETQVVEEIVTESPDVQSPNADEATE